ncbi:MAG: MoxR family ATPase, partial [Anaerolineae bacterium]|nr:MoxR family ATPase [Anaerolineae bacterium]
MQKFNSDVEAVDALAKAYHDLKNEIAKVIVGQDEVVKAVIISLFSNGHSLLVGVPGLAKTLLVDTSAKALGLNSNRVQCTPDLMPADILGSEVLDSNDKGQRTFRFIKGPVFTQL